MVLMELCSLHFRVDPTPEQIIQQFLFADGAIRVDATSDFRAGAFALLDHAEAMIPRTASYMTWRAASPVFDMHLGQEVVEAIDEHVFDFVTVFLERNGLRVQDVARFAVHPGGPKIIRNTANALHLEEAVVQHSLDVLRTRGNMSSTTLPHIWNRMATDPKVQDGELICSIAFGPGLSMMVNLMRKGP
jgi:predicted naringenin-chalcone synthase